MNLTTEMLKKLIKEELEGAADEKQPDKQQQTNPADAQKEKTNSTTKLKAELIELSRNITKIQGLDPNELDLISGLMASMIKIASSGSGATIMKRVYDVLQKHIK